MPGGGFWGSQGYGLTGPAAAGSGSIGGNISKTTPGSATGGVMPFGAGGGNTPQGFNPRGNGMVRGGGGALPRPGQASPAQAGPSQPFTQPGQGAKPAYGASMPGKGGVGPQSVYQKFQTQFSSNPFRDRLRQRGAALGLGQNNSTVTPTQVGQQFTGQQGSQAQFDYFNNIISNGGTLDPYEMAQWAQLRNQYGQTTGDSGVGGGGAA